MMELGNLGGYQLLVMAAKRVGGPEALVGLLMMAGAGIVKLADCLLKQ